MGWLWGSNSPQSSIWSCWAWMGTQGSFPRLPALVASNESHSLCLPPAPRSTKWILAQKIYLSREKKPQRVEQTVEQPTQIRVLQTSRCKPAHPIEYLVFSMPVTTSCINWIDWQHNSCWREQSASQKSKLGHCIKQDEQSW